MMRMMKVLLLLLPLAALNSSLAEAGSPAPAEKPLPVFAHAHNDYEHDYPLLEALHHGFSSIEVDVHLVHNAFYVAHDLEEIVPGRTIRSLYLDPLREMVQENNGSVYRDGSGIYLLVDVKTEHPDVWRELRSELMDYSGMLTFFREGKVEKGPVTVIISGSRDWAAMSEDPNCPAFYDGRIEDLSDKPASLLIPLISAGWADEFKWEGEGLIPASDLQKMKAVIAGAHSQGRLVRFWATDVPGQARQKYVWDLLLEAGVDVINTDKLREFRDYLTGKFDENGI